MNTLLERTMADLEERIDPLEEELLLHQWLDFSEDRFTGDVFAPRRRRLSPPKAEWPVISVNNALQSFEQMALYQYGDCSAKLATGSGSLLNVRPNFGSSIIPLLFGAKPFVMPEEANTLPGAVPLGDRDAICRLVEAGVPDIHKGYADQVFQMAVYYQELARKFPKIGRYVHIYHPDFQGPMDICEIVWGSQFFYALYDESDLVKAFLEIITQTFSRLMQEWIAIVPPRPEGNAHWGLFHKGTIMLRDDSAMNLSPDMFDEFVRPYDQRLLDEFGGGAIHFCGRGDHYIARMSTIRGLHAINLTQPDYNHMETIFCHTVDKGIKLIGLPPAGVETALRDGRGLRGQVHVGIADQRRLRP